MIGIMGFSRFVLKYWLICELAIIFT